MSQLVFKSIPRYQWRTLLSSWHRAKPMVWGFTLIELTVSVGIVGVLSALAVGVYSQTVARARFDTARQVLLKIYDGEWAYFNKHFPDGGDGTTFSPWVGGVIVACAAGDVNCHDAWRSLGMEDPNGVSGEPGAVTYAFASNRPPPIFLAIASYGGKVQMINQDKVFCPPAPGCTWMRP